MNDNNVIQAQKLFYESLDFQKLGNFINAKEKLLEALKLFPGRESIINNLAIIYFNLDDPLSLEGLIDDQKITNINLKNLITIYTLYLRKNFKDCIDLCLKNVNSNSNNFDQLIDILIKCYFKNLIMSVTENMGKNMGKELIHLIVEIYMKEIGKKEKNMGKENIYLHMVIYMKVIG